jgi:hypothetical protein
MLLRALLTTAFVAVGTAAVLIVDCTSTIIDLFDDDLANVCDGVIILGSDGGLRVGVGLGVFALLGIFATWVPFIRDKVRLRKHEPARALAENLPRLAEVGTHLDEIENVPTLGEIAAARLVKKVEAVETAIISEAIPTREATQQWMRLLRQANDLHNDGTLEPEDFKRINTRLLDLFFVPQDESGGHKGASSR